MTDSEKSWTLDDTTRASNAGGLKVKPLVWLSEYPRWPIIWMGVAAFMLVCGIAVHWSYLIVFAILVAMNWLYWRRVRDHFTYGAVNPAVVVAEHPMRIAVLTDLSKGTGKFPVVKIVRKELPRRDGSSWRVGSTLATVSLYSRHPDEKMPRWANFDPRPAVCATDDARAIDVVTRSIPREEWDELTDALKQIPTPFVPGTFHLFEDV
jgi:hypothetical protein